MKCWIGLGSNLGVRRTNLERAALAISELRAVRDFRASSIYQSPALVPPGAPSSWRNPFLNAVVEFEWSETSRDLLNALRKIESNLGRTPSEKWSPRIIDLDLLLFGENTISESELKVPHPHLWDRSFVMDPLKDLAPDLIVPGKHETVLVRSRQLDGHAPLWMGIVNVTPDSFSLDGIPGDPSAVDQVITDYASAGVSMIDIGAESTRPGATFVSAETEWARLQPVLEIFNSRFKRQIFRPRLSIDTRHMMVAEFALEYGVDCINDVSGLMDSRMVQFLEKSECDYVLMHSLSVPTDKNVTLPHDCDPVAVLKAWALCKIEQLTQARINLRRVIFDPGLGFGKTAEQSLTILRRIDEFSSLPVRVLVGHSRKSFINFWGERSASERDWESVGVSLQMATRKVDILRVHNPQSHLRAYHAYQEVSQWNR